MLPKKIIDAYDLSEGDKSIIFNIDANLKHCFQAVWADLTGTLNGKISFFQSLDGTNFDLIKTYTDLGLVNWEILLDSADGSEHVENTEGFVSYWIKVTVDVNSITGGTLTLWYKE